MNNYIGYMIYIHVQYLPQITLHRILSTSWTPNNTYHPSGHRRPPAASPSRAARRQHLLRLRCAAGRWPRGDIGGGDVEGWRKRRTKGGSLWDENGDFTSKNSRNMWNLGSKFGFGQQNLKKSVIWLATYDNSRTNKSDFSNQKQGSMADHQKEGFTVTQIIIGGGGTQILVKDGLSQQQVQVSRPGREANSRFRCCFLCSSQRWKCCHLGPQQQWWRQQHGSRFTSACGGGACNSLCLCCHSGR